MNRGKTQKREATSGTTGDVSMTTSTTFLSVSIQLILLSVAGLIVFKTVSDVGIILFTFHPCLMAIGYLILMVQAIFAISGRSMFADVSSHDKRVYAHWVFQTLALILITIAQASIYINKNNNGYPHYQTIHSYFGLGTYIATVVGMFGGSATKYGNSLKSFVKPIQLKIGHGMLGSALFVFVAITICLGINQTWTNEADAQLKLGTMAIIFISALFVISKSIKTALSRVASMSKK